MRVGTLWDNNIRQSDSGFSLVELIIVITIVAILSGFAVPSILELSRDMKFRQASREIVSTFRKAKDYAISKNVQHRVNFNASTRQYLIIQGNSLYRSTAWSPLGNAMMELPIGVFINFSSGFNTLSVQFNPNGTALDISGGLNSAIVKIQDSTAKTRYLVTVEKSGRIRTSR